MKFLKSTGWTGITSRRGRTGQTEITNYDDALTNSSQQSHDTAIAGTIDLGSVSFTYKEDASVIAIKQKCIDQEVVEELVIEDVQANAAATVLRRVTLSKVMIVAVKVAIDDRGDGVVTVTLRCQKAKWERATPTGEYAEVEWNPNGL